MNQDLLRICQIYKYFNQRLTALLFCFRHHCPGKTLPFLLIEEILLEHNVYDEDIVLFEDSMTIGDSSSNYTYNSLGQPTYNQGNKDFYISIKYDHQSKSVKYNVIHTEYIYKYDGKNLTKLNVSNLNRPFCVEPDPYYHQLCGYNRRTIESSKEHIYDSVPSYVVELLILYKRIKPTTAEYSKYFEGATKNDPYDILAPEYKNKYGDRFVIEEHNRLCISHSSCISNYLKYIFEVGDRQKRFDKCLSAAQQNYEQKKANIEHINQKYKSHIERPVKRIKKQKSNIESLIKRQKLLSIDDE